MAYAIDSRGVCPYCLQPSRFEHVASFPNAPVLSRSLVAELKLARNQEPVFELGYAIFPCACAACGGVIIMGQSLDIDGAILAEEPWMLAPRYAERPIPSIVREDSPEIAADFAEAVAVLGISSKASAALSRRCLQALLREKAGANHRDLSRQIEYVLPALPSYIADNLDAIRNVGNFAAHPMKDTASGLILDVEPGEAEWNLEVLDELFDFYYVQPMKARERRERLNTKLEQAGKPLMKRPE